MPISHRQTRQIEITDIQTDTSSPMEKNKHTLKRNFNSSPGTFLNAFVTIKPACMLHSLAFFLYQRWCLYFFYTIYMVQVMADTFPFCIIVIGFNNNSRSYSVQIYNSKKNMTHYRTQIYGIVFFCVDLSLFVCNANFNWNIEFWMPVFIRNTQRVYLDENMIVCSLFLCFFTYVAAFSCHAYILLLIFWMLANFLFA